MKWYRSKVSGCRSPPGGENCSLNESQNRLPCNTPICINLNKKTLLKCGFHIYLKEFFINHASKCHYVCIFDKYTHKKANTW